jgi:hypothetical protein
MPILTFNLYFDTESVDATLAHLRTSGLPAYSGDRVELRRKLFDQVAEEFARYFDGKRLSSSALCDVALPLISFRTAMAVFIPSSDAFGRQSETILVRVNALPGSENIEGGLWVAIVTNPADKVKGLNVLPPTADSVTLRIALAAEDRVTAAAILRRLASDIETAAATGWSVSEVGGSAVAERRDPLPWPVPSPAAVDADPAASYWLKNTVQSALARDPVDAINDAELLLEILKCHRPS